MFTSACYREFLPSAALRAHVRAFFSFSIPAAPAGPSRLVTREVFFDEGQRSASHLFADGHTSLVFSFGVAYRVENLWQSGSSRGYVIGPMSQAQSAWHGGEVIQVGVYLRAVRARELIAPPIHEIADRIVAIEDIWGSAAAAVEERISAARDDGERVSLLEQFLTARLGTRPRRTNIAALAEYVLIHRGGLSVEQLASDAGVSRQYLTRVFREDVGVTPKLYSRLARFRAALASMNSISQSWAGGAAELGFSDQSHFIADFKQFSGATPGAMVAERRFHPFVSDAGHEAVPM